MLCDTVKLGIGGEYRAPNVDTLDRAHSGGAPHSLSFQLCVVAVGRLVGSGLLLKKALTPSPARTASDGNRKPWEYLRYRD
jgi:hypothetical protein